MFSMTLYPQKSRWMTILWNGIYYNRNIQFIILKQDAFIVCVFFFFYLAFDFTNVLHTLIKMSSKPQGQNSWQEIAKNMQFRITIYVYAFFLSLMSLSQMIDKGAATACMQNIFCVLWSVILAGTGHRMD